MPATSWTRRTGAGRNSPERAVLRASRETRMAKHRTVSRNGGLRPCGANPPCPPNRPDQLAIEVPGRVAEDRDHDGKAEEERQRAKRKAGGDAQAPYGDRPGIGDRGADRGQHRRRQADVAIKEERKR